MEISNRLRYGSSRKRLVWRIIACVLFLGVIAVGIGYIWYNVQLKPVDSANKQPQLVEIQAGSTPSDIATTLSQKKLIRNTVAFMIYTRLHGNAEALQAGTYRLSPAESLSEIVTHLVNGKVDVFTITFLPGATLKENREVLITAGYPSEEVDKALVASYNSTIFEGKPSDSSLEGYIFGDSYTFPTGASVRTILQRTFQKFETEVSNDNLIAAFQTQHLSLYQAITLASIIQREASPKGDDMPQIAQVFYRRLALNMPLGSDVTYQYAADRLGVARSPELDSPYNTRKYTGLPPGPIATPGTSALQAVAHPADGDYLYFLSGDDNVTYFARSLTEHENNIKNHCQNKCKIL